MNAFFAWVRETSHFHDFFGNVSPYFFEITGRFLLSSRGRIRSISSPLLCFEHSLQGAIKLFVRRLFTLD
jgi:hypothetical protein